MGAHCKEEQTQTTVTIVFPKEVEWHGAPVTGSDDKKERWNTYPISKDSSGSRSIWESVMYNKGRWQLELYPKRNAVVENIRKYPTFTEIGVGGWSLLTQTTSSSSTPPPLQSEAA